MQALPAVSQWQTTSASREAGVRGKPTWGDNSKRAPQPCVFERGPAWPGRECNILYLCTPSCCWPPLFRVNSSGIDNTAW